MFRKLLNDAKSAASSLVLKYVARASVAVPFVIGAGFAVAAITLMLVERLGHVTAYWTMAGGLAAIGAIAALVVSVKEQEEEAADQAAENADTANTVAETAAQAPLALLGALSAAPLSPSTVMPVVRLLARNLPLVLLMVLIGLLFWPTEEGETSEEDQRPLRQPNGADPLPSELRH
jgi:hypothetical protein